MSSRLGLGIDTGGTYTDACLFDFDARTVFRSAKAPTTYHNLAEGIIAAVQALGAPNWADVQMVSLSTTLATNAIVEGRGGREGLLLIGYDPALMQRLSKDAGLELHERVYFISGKLDIFGKEVEPVNLEQVRQAILSVLDQGVDAIGISGYLSVLNPAHELAVRQLAAELTKLPITCGHELTSRLQAVKRAATVALNARLIPIIQDLLASVQRALTELGVTAPLFVVQGDGSLVRAERAEMQPVQTILSGPAASCIGGAYLSGQENCIVVDMGGTTSDIALLRQGRPELDPEGASVGNWRTSIAAAQVRTTGLGGDSHIRFLRNGQIEIGPRRVIPLCMVAAKHPPVAEEVRRLAAGATDLSLVQLFDFLTLVRVPGGLQLSASEADLVAALREQPLSLFQLAERLGTSHPVLLDTARLERLGVVRRIGLTPTDVMHATGSYTAWDTETATTALAAMATICQQEYDALLRDIETSICRRLALEIVAKLAGTGETEPLTLPGDRAAAALLDLALGKTSSRDKGGLGCHFSLDYPLVALGAPGGVYLERVARMLGGRLVVPPHAGVANAVGAVTGRVIRTVTCRVVPLYNVHGITGFAINGLTCEDTFPELKAALQTAIKLARSAAEEAAAAAGAQHVTVQVETKEVGQKVLLEVEVKATALGEPAYGVAGALLEPEPAQP